MKVLDKIFFSKIAANVIACYRKHIFGTSGGKGAKDIDGKNYPKYSPEYEEAKRKQINNLEKELSQNDRLAAEIASN